VRIPPLILLILTVVGWASAFPAIRVALPAFGPVPLALARFAVSSLALLLVALKFRPPALQRRDLPAIAMMGLLGFALYAIGLNIGEQTVNAGTAAFIVQTAPLWSTLLAVLFCTSA
jgi:drug/metabolite transporter (DMT)-like permease